MEDWLSRTRLLLGEEKLLALKNANVLVIGLGGVGAYTAEMLCRAGIGNMTIADADQYHASNINRQLMALHSTLDQPKTEIMKDRLLDINPEFKLKTIRQFLKDEELIDLINSEFDYICDAIDTLSPKTYLIKTALEKKYELLAPWAQEEK